MTITRIRPWATAIAVALSATALAGCSAFEQDLDGVTATESFDVDSFHAIELNDSGDVTVQVGPEASVTATGDTALLKRLRVRVTDGVLSLDRSSFDFTWSGDDIDYVVTVPSLDALDVSGSGDVDIAGVDSAQFSVSLTGSGDIVIVGTAPVVAAELDGSGLVDLSGLRAERATVDLSGSGDVLVHADEALGVDLSGSGDVHYTGSPRVDADISGSGVVRAS